MYQFDHCYVCSICVAIYYHSIGTICMLATIFTLVVYVVHIYIFSITTMRCCVCWYISFRLVTYAPVCMYSFSLSQCSCYACHETILTVVTHATCMTWETLSYTVYIGQRVQWPWTRLSLSHFRLSFTSYRHQAAHTHFWFSHRSKSCSVTCVFRPESEIRVCEGHTLP